jgi:hypothetical protein
MLLFISTPLVVPAVAQSTTTYSPALLQRAAKLNRTLPDDLIYTIFFKELAARERQAAKWQSQGMLASASDLRDRAREVMQVSPERYGTLKAIALECAGSLDAIDAQQKTLASSLVGMPASPSMPPELAALESERAAALAQARSRMRDVLGAEGFVATDYWIYLYISSHVHPV